MSSKSSILIEAALVVGVLTTGIATANVAHAAPLAIAAQSTPSQVAPDPRRNIVIESQVAVERIENDANGKSQVKLFTPGQVKVVPGDKLVFTNSYRNMGKQPVTGFLVNNPVHAAVAFSGVEENWAVVSVDGGKSFGKLETLTVTESIADETATGQTKREARPADVTHIRWVFAEAIPAGASGKLHFRGIVK